MGSTRSFGSSYYRASGVPRPARGGGLGPRSGTARQARRTGGWANPVAGGELKFSDVTGTGTALGLAAGSFTTPGPTFLLNGLIPDSTATGRIGRKVVMKSLYIRADFRMASTSTQGGMFRMIVFYDKQANANAPAVTDLLLADAFLSPNNLSNRDRFVVLVDEVTSAVSTAGDYATQLIRFKKNLNLETMFNAGTAGTIGDITSGSIYIMFAQNGTIGTAAPTVNWRSRIRYSDN